MSFYRLHPRDHIEAIIERIFRSRNLLAIKPMRDIVIQELLEGFPRV